MHDNTVKQYFYADMKRVAVALVCVTTLSTAVSYWYVHFGLGVTLGSVQVVQLLAFMVAGSCIVLVGFALLHYNSVERNLAGLYEKAELGENAVTVAHDIRGPLASLHVAIRHLPDGELKSEKSAEVMGLLRRSATRLQGVADEFLEAKRSAEDPELTNVHEVIDGLYQEYRSRPDLSEVRFQYATAPQALFVQGEGVQLQRMVANIAKNALEAMGGVGSLSFQVELKRSLVHIHITDTGPGMGDTMAQAIMAGTSRSAGKSSGHGIGLRFVHNTLESMGGSISVVSERGEGTTMTLRIPRATAGQANNVVSIHQVKSG